jgi:hypothetical protein
MILDEYGPEGRRRFSSSAVLNGMALAHHLPKFEFEGLSVFLNHLYQER